MIRVGPAGWSYPDWEGRVYPRSKPPGFHPLAHLARFVQTVEINSTFYGLANPRHAEVWCQMVAGHRRFRFAAKLLRAFTHDPVSNDESSWESLAQRYLEGLAPLRRARRLAAILVQFPVSFQHGTEEVTRLHRIHALFGEVPLVLEVRHHSWFEPAGLNAVRGLGFSLAHIDLPRSWDHPPDWHVPTGPLGYLRLHGRNSADWFRRGAGRDARYDYLYSTEEIEEQAARAERLSRDHEDTYVITNNHFEGKAMVAALQLMYAMTGETQRAPAELIEAYPELKPITRLQGQRTLFQDP